MASIQSKLLVFLLRQITKRKILRKQFASGKSGFFNSPEPSRKILRTCHVHKFKINNRNIFTINPRSTNCSDKHILYLHGGAYVQSFVVFHWRFLAKLVKKLNCTITAPDYPLAPDHTYKESFAIVMALYTQLISSIDPRNIVFMGDSSGGGFALALAQELRSKNIEQPSQIILLSPWLDITLTNPLIKDIDAVVPLLGIEGLRQAGEMYAGDTSPDCYLLSPITGSLEGLGKMSVFMGSRDILVADARKLKSLAESKGITLNYYEYAGMIHAWMFLNLPESKKARQQIIDLIG